MPTRPQPVRLRSAIVIVETETGETMQMILTPTPWQPVEVQMDMVREEPYGLLDPPGEPTWTVTLTSGGYVGQWRGPVHESVQAGPAAVEG